MNREQAKKLCDAIDRIGVPNMRRLVETGVLESEVLANYEAGNIGAFADGALIKSGAAGISIRDREDIRFTLPPECYKVVETRWAFNVERAMNEGAWGAIFLFKGQVNVFAKDTKTPDAIQSPGALRGIIERDGQTMYLTDTAAYRDIQPARGHVYPEGWFERCTS